MFDLEPRLYVFDFKTFYNYSGYVIQILVAEQYSYYIAFWHSQEDFEEFSDSIKGFENFQSSILLAMELPLNFLQSAFILLWRPVFKALKKGLKKEVNIHWLITS